MKILPITLLLIVMIFAGCEKDSNTLEAGYDYMHFTRQGGGQIDFNVYSADNVDQVKVIISKINFRDTTIQIIMDSKSENTSAISSFYDVLNNKVQINGDFQQSTLLTGTWAYIYFVANTRETEVTNTGLRDTLLKFEQLVRDKIEPESIIVDYEISINGEFQIELISNPTTGYSWAWVNKQTVDIVDTVDWSYIADTPVIAGSGGKEIWIFKGIESGVDSIKMEYCRFWDSNSTIDSKIVIVKVK